MEPMITLTNLDHLRLQNLFSLKECNFAHLDDQLLTELEEEVERAQVVDFNEVPGDIVTMYSKVRYLNLKDKKLETIQIVYPQHASTNLNRVSVIAPLGAALIGLKVGDEISWKFPDGEKKHLKVMEILYQPESSGDYHL